MSDADLRVPEGTGLDGSRCRSETGDDVEYAPAAARLLDQ